MDWQVIGAISEVLASVGVIVSLLFLSIQLRENTKAMSTQSQERNLDELKIIWSKFIDDPELATTWIRALRGEEALTENEKNQFRYLFYTQMLTYQRQYLRAIDMNDSYHAELTLKNSHQLISKPGAKRIYGQLHPTLREQFRDALKSSEK
jgi:hypothetical protein